MLLNKKNELTKKKIGFIGVGIMGEGMVYKLIEAKYKLFVKKNKNSVYLIGPGSGVSASTMRKTIYLLKNIKHVILQSLIHNSEPTRRRGISYAVIC